MIKDDDDIYQVPSRVFPRDSRGYTFYQPCPEWDLNRAAYHDDVEAVRKILEEHPRVDVNIRFTGLKCGNGSALVLTGSAEIAELLLAKGADVNLLHGIYEQFTALDSAYKELNKDPVRESVEKTEKINQLISLLRAHGGLRYSEMRECSLTG